MKLEKKHLAPYLPYDLKVKVGITSIAVLTGGDTSADTIAIDYFLTNSAWKPILRPLSDLTKQIQIAENFKSFFEHLNSIHPMFKDCTMEMDSLGIHYSETCLNDNLDILNKLFEWHFDVFGLIKKGLAIDINTLK